MTLLKAFEQTKRGWEWIIENSPDDWDDSPVRCGFCTYSIKQREKNPDLEVCEVCPIYQITGVIMCIETPFAMRSSLENALLEYDFIHHVAYATGILKP